ncbi:four helix bundle protein [Roseimicrobium gellanilyticum]|uniref:Four helix bundle protein n=1 Tax=Roseimicrobium gellanilyticum TaxID=748857 RepID=A0A366HSA8_9BACT|nr:four helix bundle protein [Roseimicrobium gellanilyticum]RBP46570.1 four helix bundle protein [Roseimicrobium gellanilyticum]
MELEYARSFHELVVYQKARLLQKEVLDLSRGFPDFERYGLTDQIRRASRSIGGQIAEGWAKRAYPRHFVSKLTDADGEQLETQHWLITSVDSQYVSRETAAPFYQLCLEIGRMLGKMILRHKDFCQPSSAILREDFEEFFAPYNPNHHPLNAINLEFSSTISY